MPCASWNGNSAARLSPSSWTSCSSRSATTRSGSSGRTGTLSLRGCATGRAGRSCSVSFCSRTPDGPALNPGGVTAVHLGRQDASGRSWDGISEPDPDRGDVDGGLVHEVALVVAGRDGAELLELGTAALDGVALPVACGVEGGRTASRAAAVAAVFPLVLLDRGDRLDAATAQVS